MFSSNQLKINSYALAGVTQKVILQHLKYLLLGDFKSVRMWFTKNSFRFTNSLACVIPCCLGKKQRRKGDKLCAQYVLVVDILKKQGHANYTFWVWALDASDVTRYMAASLCFQFSAGFLAYSTSIEFT